MFLEGFIQQVGYLIFNANMLFKIFIDYQELFYQAFSNNIFFWNLYQQSILVVFRCSGTTDNLIRIEQSKNVICFDRIILM